MHSIYYIFQTNPRVLYLKLRFLSLNFHFLAPHVVFIVLMNQVFSITLSAIFTYLNLISNQCRQIFWVLYTPSSYLHHFQPNKIYISV